MNGTILSADLVYNLIIFTLLLESVKTVRVLLVGSTALTHSLIEKYLETIFFVKNSYLWIKSYH